MILLKLTQSRKYIQNTQTAGGNSCRRVILYVLLIFLIIALPAQSQTENWKLVDSIRFNGYTPEYIAISCTDSNNCNAVMNLRREVYNRVTTDGGNSWAFTLKDTTVLVLDSNGKVVKSIWPTPSSGIAYPDTNLCVIICDSGVYWRSTDKCRTWKKDTISPVLMYLRKLSMPNAKTGGVLGYTDQFSPLILYITNDSAKTWRGIPLSDLDTVSGDKDYDKLLVLDSLTYRLIGYKQDHQSYLLGTDDGGKKWNILSFFPFSASKIYFTSKINGWAVGSHEYAQYKYNDVIMHTIDGGINWDVVIDTNFIYNSNGLAILAFADSLHGTACGRWGRIWKTDDGGITWERNEKVYINGLPRSLLDIAMPSPFTIFALDKTSGHIYKYSPFFSEVQESFIVSDGLLIFPNPAVEFIEIINPSEGLEPSDGSLNAVRIFNVFGEELMKSSDSNNSQFSIFNSQLRIDVSGLPSGIYFVRVVDRVMKFVKI